MRQLARALAYAFFSLVHVLANVFVFTLGGPHVGGGLMLLCEEAQSRLLPPPIFDRDTDLRYVYGDGER